jgi:hypothetical protein
MQATRIVAVCALLILAVGARAETGCSRAVSIDNYSYALAHNLQNDFLQSIDTGTWDYLRSTGSSAMLGGFALDQFSFSDDYLTFSSKRLSYLANRAYSRTQEQALDVLQKTAWPRSFDFLEKCMRGASSSREPLRMWITHEDPATVSLTILNNGSVRVPISLMGFVEGGEALNMRSPGRLWEGRQTWAPGEERTMTIRRGVSSRMLITIAPEAIGATTRLESRRADLLLSLEYAGQLDVLIARNRSTSLATPNNNENRGNCPNEVGRHDGRYCTSRTALQLTTSLPGFFANPRANYSGNNCPWCFASAPTISADGSTVEMSVDNWGSPVTAVLIADEYRHVSSKECGPPAFTPAEFGDTVVLNVPSNCVGLTTIRWTSVINPSSRGYIKYGDKGSGPLTLVGAISSESEPATSLSYKVLRAQLK